MEMTERKYAEELGDPTIRSRQLLGGGARLLGGEQGLKAASVAGPGDPRGRPSEKTVAQNP